MPPKKEKPEHLEVVTGDGRKRAHPPRIIEHIRQQAQEACVRLLEHMFSATDDLFYDLSKRATSNNEQNLYFESMREIRIKRRGVASTFTHELSAGFDELVSGHQSGRNGFNNADANPSQLSIVESDVLEVELALSNMTSRTRDSYKEELYELTIRLDHLMLEVRVAEENNPLDPECFAQAFVKACESQLKINIKARLILFKLFEKHVLKQLGHIYSDANQTLVDAGILPKVPRGLNRNRSAESVAAPSTDTPIPSMEQAAENTAAALQFQLDVNALSALMANVRTSGNAVANGGTRNSGPYTYYLYSSNPGPIMASPQLNSLLTRSQPVVDRQLSNLSPKNIITEVVNQLLAKRDPEVPQALEQPDEDIINLIAMFFDNVLADENLPIVVQSLICRLQIPLLKVALRDRTFLTNEQHPARRLINTITSAGLAFDETKPLERDALYRKIADGVQTINRLYRTDDSVFATVLEDLENDLAKEKRKARLVEQRTTQAEQGKSRIRHARAAAQSTLYRKLKDEQLPEAVGSFLANTWLQVMIITHLKHGKESTEWVEAENLISDIVWLCQPRSDVRALARRERLQPEVLQRIESGLEAAIDNPETRQAKVDAIAETLITINDLSDDTGGLTPLTDDQKSALGKLEPDQKTWEEMTALERQQSRYEELSNRFYSQAKDIPTGTWVEYLDEASSKHIRCKLSSKIDTDSYIFVNRFGLKILDRSRRQFAVDMQFKRAKILDSRPMFERLMGKVVTHLKQAA